MRRVMMATAFATMAVTMTGAVAARMSVSPVDRMVPVRGTDMHFRIYPGDTRTILIESGSGLGAETWNDLAPKLAARTGATVITYDRAGLGSSPALATAYDIHEEIGRLHAGLRLLGRERGLVLVGHSYGGYLIQVYANLYPGDVHGMVYVDPNTVRGIDGLGGARKMAESSVKRNDVPDATPLQRANLRASLGLEATQEVMRRYPALCGVPVVVLTATRDLAKVSGGGEWHAGHRDLVAETNGEAVTVPDASHMLHRDRPDLVIDAVARVLVRAKTARPVLGAPGKHCPH